MTSAGGLVPVARRRPGGRVAVALGPGGRRARRGGDRGRVRVRRRGQLRHGWDEHRRVPRPRPRARARRPSASSPASRSGCPRSTCTRRRGRRFDRAPRRGRRARRRARAVRARCPGPRVTAAVATSRRSPTPIWCSGASRPTPRSPISVGSTSAAAAARARARGCRRPRASCASSTRRWNARCAAVTVERGVDPRELALVAFGGAGPLHACAIAGRARDAGGRRPAARRRVLGRGAALRAPGARGGAQRSPAGRSPTRSHGVEQRGAGACRRRTRSSRPRSTAGTSGRATS